MIQNFFIIDIKTFDEPIQSWDLPKAPSGGSVGGLYLKIDEENIYFTPQNTHCVYFYTKNGTEIKKFGTFKASSKEGEFRCPRGITVDEKYLYICDSWNERLQVLDKKKWKYYL